jgi:hypothetical protein
MLSLPLHGDDAGLAQFFQVMRDGAGRDVETFCQFPDAGGESVIIPAAAGAALFAKAHQDGEAMGMAEGLEQFGGSGEIKSTRVIRHISKYE